MFLLVTALFILLAPASDDEGSTAATDGSTLRTSPADHGGSVGSESGGSAVDSVAGEHSGEYLSLAAPVSVHHFSTVVGLYQE